MAVREARVLVVDDDAQIRDVVATVLEDGGYHVETASNGPEALRKAEANEPDVVILDVTMPVMGGWAFLAKWRARPADRRAPVLVISSARDRRTALDRGAKAYLSKPFDLETLETTLAGVL
jgi:CheY-like chemotaxis protein